MLTTDLLTLVHPGDPDWDAARTGFNTAVDQHPAAVAYPADEREVAAAIAYARERGLRIAPQSTGHNNGPHGTLDGTLLLDVSRLDHVSIDADALRVRVGAGVRWQQVVPQLSELGLAALHGSSPLVGIAGYSLGGGMGWLARKHGLQTNAVTALELVTADGQLVRTDATHDPELFWALRGGGGNFGVVTAIEFAVVPLEELYAGQLFFGIDRAAEVLQAWRELLPTLPDELMTWVGLMRFPDDPEVPEPVRGGAFAIVYAAFLGNEVEGRRLLAPVRDLGPAMDTFAMVPPAGLADLALDPTEPLSGASAHALLHELTPGMVDDLVAIAGPGIDTPLVMLQLRHMGGALARALPGAGARATLPGEVSLFTFGLFDDPAGEIAVAGALQAVERAALPHRAGDYPNFVEEPATPSAFFDEATWRRLREVKARVDPFDVFRANHHIPPA